MDTWGFILLAVGLILYFTTKKTPFFLFVSGVGAGIVVGAIWAMFIINATLH